jgi:hypothetical protein
MNHRMQRSSWTAEALAGLLVLAAVACVEKAPAGPTPPTPPPPLTGAYTLTVEASAVCKLPIPRFQWEVEATSSGTASAAGDTMVIRATLPAGDDTVDLSLSTNITSVASGSLDASSAPSGDEGARVSLGGPSRGTITTGPAGRGQIVDGTYNGEIALAPPDDRDIRSAGSCTAADHKWTLVPRQAQAPP